VIAFTPDRGQKRVVTEDEVQAEFADFSVHFMLEDDEGSRLLATGEGFGPYTLEWFPAERSGSHLTTIGDLDRGKVLATMLDYLRGGTAWRESRQWHEVSNEQPGWLDRLLTGMWRGRA
jgi:hypothetical protein